MMIRVTGFFRDPHVWDAMADRVVRPLVEARENEGAIRCWITACSTGEDAYTLGILLLEAAEAANKTFDIKIFATDTAERSLGPPARAASPTASRASSRPTGSGVGSRGSTSRTA